MRISVARTLAMVRTRWKQGAAFYNTPVTKSKVQSGYDPACRDCPRLAAYLDQVRQVHPDYHARPVAPFGPKRAALLVVGLAPGLHGANRTGRPFTGDHAGILLYGTLHRYGFAVHELSAASPATRLFDSYHCSRYNTQTKRLTVPMFEAVVRDIATFLRGAR